MKSLIAFFMAVWPTLVFSQAPLTSVELQIQGTRLEVTPAILSIPKGIAGSISAKLSNNFVPPASSFLEATLRGPSFPARRLIGDATKPLLLPPLNLVGDYQLDGIRLVDGVSGATLFEGTPSSVPVKVFDEVLVSRVTSRPLTLDEIQEKGIVIDEQNFRAIEFEVGFVLDGKTIPVKFPVVSPSFTNNTEIIPAAELEERLKQAEDINNELALGVVLPPELEAARFDIQVKGINFQFVDEGDGEDLALKIPPIPALMVIPGNIGFLNQFFSVMIFTENGSPNGSGLSARAITAELVLPLGPDRVAGTFALPGDDPLRFARVGEAAVIQPVQPVRQLGPDGRLGTADDVDRLLPGETGQGEFLVEGLQEGLHVMDLKLNAILDGLAAGPVNIEGRAAGSVLVRNPKFSLAFAHPRTVRAGEPYEAFVTILNTSLVPANLVNVTLNKNSISGGVLEPDETGKTIETVELGTILPGQTATAKFRIRSQRTGAITFSNLTTSDDSLIGRFRLRAGVDERDVPLSPDTLLLPNFVDELPAELVAAANRVLGQALSVAKAGQPPAGVLRVSMAELRQKAIELAEAGQRVRYGDTLEMVLPDLLLDWQGARSFSAGFDQILRETNAGLEWREALMRAIENGSSGFATTRLLEAARAFAGRGEAWVLGAVSVGVFQDVSGQTRSGNEFELVKSPAQKVTLGKSTLPKALGYPGRVGAWLASADAGAFEWRFAEPVESPFQTNVVLVRADGTATELLWRLEGITAGACLHFDATSGGTALQVDDQCDGVIDRILDAQRTDFTELPPTVLAVRQDPEVLVGRPNKACFSPTTNNEAGKSVVIQNYANVLAVLFSKPMGQAQANVPSAYQLDDGNQAAFVQVQPGGRIALLTMRQPVGKLIPREMTVASSVKDARGNSVVPAPVDIESQLEEGITVRGRVLRADGAVSVGVPVTLTYYDEVDAGLSGCLPWTIRSAQMFTNASGEFQFDFVLAGIPYSVSATDTSGLSPELIAALLESTRGDALDRDRLLELAASPSVQNTLLAEFAVGALPEAIAKAEGIDRALVRDSVEPGSARLGTTAVYALRFRGRGTVSGQVFAADGVSPVQNAAVNLFPSPDSRELGRGVFTDSNGQFAFFGVPLGVFSVEATSPAGQTRVISDLLSSAGEVKQVQIVLSVSIPTLTELQGRITEPTGEPHGGGQVFVGQFIEGKFGSVVAVATADGEGFWRANAIPAGDYDLVALSADGKRKGERRDILAVAGAVNTVNLTLQARATVTGLVQTSTGLPVANALVGGGETLVSTDALGRFTLTGVPTGQRSIDAVLDRDEAAGITFPRMGSATVNVIPGATNFVIVRLVPAGRIIGRVLDAEGNPVPNVDVAIPQTGGFLWVYADAEGDFEFVGLPLGEYDVSSPAPPHEDIFDGEAAAKALVSASQDEILATIGEAFAAFTGVNNPLLNGEGGSFNPAQWGFTENVVINDDGDTVRADVKFLQPSTIAGVVKNGQGVPIGARVRLTGVGPSLTGAPTFMIRGERDSDPALGTFEFPGQALLGDWGLQAASPFFPVVVSTSGRTTSADPDDTDNILQFPSVRETNGSLSGQVLKPDGSPAGAGVSVQISFGPDFIIQTDADGKFATQRGTFTLPAIGERGPGVGYTVTATDAGVVGRSTVVVMPAQDNFVTVRLLGRGEASITVTRADGSPAVGAEVEIQGGAFPARFFEETTDSNGRVVFQNVDEGPYAINANFGTGLARIAGRGAITVTRDTTANATIVLAGTGRVRGIFLAGDGSTPVSFANVSLGSLAFSATGADGRFDFSDVPLGTYRIIATDAVTGRSGLANVTLNVNGEVRDVTVVETALGEVFGRVINALDTGSVPNAQVTLTHSDGFVPSRTVTTGPDGAFRFPGTPAGAFTLSARDPLTGMSGQASATLPDSARLFELNVAFNPVANLTVTVFEPDGVTPATDATVQVSAGDFNVAPDTDAQGRVRFENLALVSSSGGLSGYRVIAESRVGGFTRRWAGAIKPLLVRGAEETLTLTLRGTGTVTGTVFLADGTTPAPGAQVKLKIGAELIAVEGGNLAKPTADSELSTGATDQGQFTFTNIPIGEVRLTAIAQALGANANVSLTANGQTVTQNLILTASGSVAGRILRQDGTTPAANTDILVTFPSQSGLPGRLNTRTGATGVFNLTPVPVGPFSVSVTNPDVGGIATRAGTVTANNQTVELGDIVLDEEFPRVVQVVPADTAVGVSTATNVELLFSEPLDPATVESSGVFIRRTDNGALTAATLTLVAPNGETALRLARLVPLAPLESEKTYQVVVVDGDLRNAVNQVTNRGPRDLVGRPLTSLFSATFTTRDDTAPTILSFTPEDGAEQVDVRTPIRLSFDEAVRSDASIVLTGPGGPVPGTTSLGVNSLVMVFVPTTNLPPNTPFTVNVSGIRDIAGNFAVGQPLTRSFTTLDTVGPTIAQLRVKDNRPPIAGTTIVLEALLATAEPGGRVRFSENFDVIGTTAPDVFEMPVTLPATGTIIFFARALDRFGNQGEFVPLSITVQPNLPPSLTFERINPAAGAVPTGGAVQVKVTATDDSGIAELRGVISGAATAPLQISNGDTITLSGTVNANAGPGEEIVVLAQARDTSGATTGEQQFLIPIRDGVGPTLSFAVPPSGEFAPGEMATVMVRGRDAFGLTRYTITGAGAFSGAGEVLVEPAASDDTRALSLEVPAGAPVTGAPFTLTIRAFDAAGNLSAPLVANLRMRDLTPPQVVAINPPNAATGISPRPVVSITFSEALAAATVTTDAIRLETAADAIAIPAAVTLQPGGLEARIVPLGVLPVNTGIRVVVGTGVTDVAGNALASATTTTFTTADFRFANPASNAQTVEGQTIQLIITPANFPAARVAFRVNGLPLLEEDTSAPFQSPAEIPAFTDVPGGVCAISAEAFDSGGLSLAVAQVNVQVFRASDDTDGDGLTNAQEIAAGTNPFVPDGTLDPDNDGRTNAQEIIAGTNPNNPDTDADGLNDGAEFTAGTNPLNADSDGDGLKDGAEGQFGANPLLTDTDGDTLSDAFEVGVGRLTLISGSFTWSQAKADAESRGGHLVTILSALEHAGLVAALGQTATNAQAWIGLSDQVIENAFAWVTGEPATTLRFGPGEPNNSNNEDFVHLRTDGLWNDNSGTAQLQYVLEMGFFTSPAQADTDGDGIRDDVDPFTGSPNRAPVAGNDNFTVNAGDSLPISIPADLLVNDSDPDGTVFEFAEFSQPVAGGTVTRPNASTLIFTPAAGFSGGSSFTYTLIDPNGLTATATVAVTIGNNTRPLAGNALPVSSNRALLFDGNDDFVNIPQSASINLATFPAWTIEAWVKPTQFNHRSFPVIYSMGLWRAAVGLRASDGRFDSWINDVAQVTSPTIPVLSEWTHVALVHDGANRRFYVNGVESGVFPSDKVTSDGHPTRIGAAGNSAPDTRSFFRGAIDEVRLWNRALAAGEIGVNRSATLRGSENGLTAYWPFEEGTGTVTGDASSNDNFALLGTSAASVPEWIVSDAPILARGQEATTLAEAPVLLPLVGTDVDNTPLTARIVSLPAEGRLFQFANGAAGAEIISVPAVVTDALFRVVYVPDAGFLGDDSFRYTMFDGALESIPARALIHVLPQFAPVTTDLWDVASGATITGSSGFLASSAGENMFGASTGLEPGNAIFADGRPAGFTHFVEWQTPQLLRLEAAGIFAFDDGAAGAGARGFTEMRLFGRMSDADPFALIATYRPGANPYFSAPQEILPLSAFVAKQFRAEFDQFSAAAIGGPRIVELDAIAETVVLVPTNAGAPIPLQNATATSSQSGFPAGASIDAVTNSSGWAITAGPTPQTLVWETATDTAATADTEFVFRFIQNFGGAHFLGCFRISATTDSRSEFADGLANGGDVSANWTVLDPTSITSTGGETFTVRPDKAVVVTGTMPSTTTHTIRFKGIAGNVTGFRLEMLNDASLGGVSGPGRTSHGNFVLSEVTAALAAIQANRAPQAANDVAAATQGFPATISNVLTNDLDPEGDLISLADFTQPAAGTGTVTSNGDGTFVFTPANGFTGIATFTYRATDPYQNSKPATVSIEVVPSLQRVWINPAGGNWNNPSNWLNGLLPGPDDIADITLAGTYTVTLNVSPIVSQLIMGNASGTQSLNISSQTLTIRHAASAVEGAVVLLPGGSLNMAGQASFARFSQTGGLLTGAGTVTVTGTFAWTDGTMAGGGKTRIAASATGTISGGANKGLNANRVLENAGTLIASGGPVLFNLSGGGSGGVINNLAGATLEAQGEVDFNHNFGTTSAINNAGVFRKTGGGETLIGSSLVAFHNTGSVEILAGTLRFEGGGSNSGTITATAGGVLQHGGGTFTHEAGSVVTLQGDLTASGGTTTFTEPATALGTLRVNGGTLVFPQTLTNGPNLVVSSGSVSFGANQTFSTISQSGGFLRGTGTVTVTGSLSWTDGTMTDAGKTLIAASATGTISGGANKGLNANRVLEIAGTVVASGGPVLFNLSGGGSGAVINILAGGTLEAQGEVDFTHNFATTSAINNAGLFRKTGGGQTVIGSTTVTFNNTGTVDVVEGTLRFEGGGNLGGNITLQTLGIMNLAAASYTIPAGTALAGSGALVLSGGNAVFAETIALSSTLSISNGAWTFNADQTFANLTLSEGFLAGTGTITVTGALSWTGGTMTGSGKTLIAASATGTISGGANKGLNANRVLENAGTLIASGGPVLFNLSGGGSGGVINNLAGATLEAQGEMDFSHNFATTSAIHNAGVFRKTGGGETLISSTSVAFHNTGSVEISAGTLRLDGGGSNSGTITAAANGALQHGGGTFTHEVGSVVTLQGDLIASGGVTTFTEPATALGTLRVNGGTLIFPQTLTNGPNLVVSSGSVSFGVNQTFSTISQSGGLLRGSGTVTVTGSLSWTDGTMTDAGKTLIAASATGTISGGANKGLNANRVLEIAGTVVASGGPVLFNLSGGGSGAVINIVAGGTLEAQGEVDFTHNFATTSAINNAGFFRKTGGGQTVIGSTTVTFNNAGTVEVVQGTLRFEGGFTQTAAAAEMRLSGGVLSAPASLTFAAGRIAGTGTISANVTNAGVIAPGIGTITVTGAYTQSAAGRAECILGGDAASGAFSKLAVTGLASLNGTLRVSSAQPRAGEIYPLVTYGSRAGTFAVVEDANGGTAIAEYLATRADVTVTTGGGPQLAPFQSFRVAANMNETSADEFHDTDGDGASDADEVIAGTDPEDATARLRFTGIDVAGSDVLLRFHAARGRLHRVETCSDLLNPEWRNVITPVLGSGSAVEVRDVGAGEARQRFYRVAVENASSPTCGTLRVSVGPLTAVSVPFQRLPSELRRVAEQEGNRVLVSGSSWRPGQWVSQPHVIRFITASGQEERRIASNTTTSLSVAGGERFSIGEGTVFEIAPAFTLENVVGNAAREVRRWNGSRWERFIHRNGAWRGSANSDRANSVLGQHEGLVVIGVPGVRREIVMAGEVVLRGPRIEGVEPGMSFVGTRAPFPLSLQEVAQPLGWRASARANARDTLSLTVNGRWRSFYFDGAHWRTPGSLKPQDGVNIPAGGAVILRRASAAN